MWRDIAIALRTRVIDVLPLTWSRSLRYLWHGRQFPSLVNPTGLSEKVNWRVLHDRRDLWNWTCDKLAMKQRVRELAPTALIPDVLWQGMDLTELDALDIDGRWILKPNNGSGQVFAGSGRPDVAVLTRAAARWDRAYQWRSLGEVVYAAASPVLLLERWIGTDDDPPGDFKVFVFHGVARFVHAHTSRFGRHQASVYTPEWERIAARQRDIEPHGDDRPRPDRLAEMLAISEQIGAEFDFIRIDLFETAEGVWFGETTPYPWTGSSPFIPRSFERLAGSYWTLPDVATLAVSRRPST